MEKLTAVRPKFGDHLLQEQPLWEATARWDWLMEGDVTMDLRSGAPLQDGEHQRAAGRSLLTSGGASSRRRC